MTETESLGGTTRLCDFIARSILVLDEFFFLSF